MTLNFNFRYCSALFCFVFLFQTLIAQHTQLLEGNTPGWVIEKANLSVRDEIRNGASQYLLLDFQTNVEIEERYSHVTILANNSEGVQQISDLTIDFDPSFQNVVLHRIDIIRDGVVINKLKVSEAKVIQREQNADRFLYNGNLSVVFNLTDIRVGDLLDYSFTLRGFNPVYSKKYVGNYVLNYTDPVDKIYKRLLIDKDKNIVTKAFNAAAPPEEQYFGDLKEFKWELDTVSQLMYDTNVPIWHEGQSIYSISEFHDWKAVVDWAVPLYQISARDEQKLAQQAEKLKLKEATREAHILNVIRFVQDEIRYLGFESGLNSMKPHAPSKILDQRFGDCKDKSLLLAGMLQSMGVDAYPMLVHSFNGQRMPNELPSPDVFNHCVVQFAYKGEMISIDPTIQSQGGKVEYIAFPDYKYGLIIKRGNDRLNEINFKNPPETIIQEMIDVADDGSAEFTVRTEYYGDRADYMRSYYLNNNIHDITNEYVNYYSGLYPTISSARAVKFLDYDRNSINKLIVEEYYDLSNIWRYTEDSSRQYFEVYPLVLSSYINYPKSPERTMPYHVGDLVKLFQKSTITMYEEWGVNSSKKTFENLAFDYSSNVSSHKNKIYIDYEYHTKSNFVEANEVPKVVSDAVSLSNDLSFYIYKSSGNEGFKISKLNLFVMTFILGLAVYLIRKFNDSALLNPLPPENRLSEEAFGGWLLLVMIGIAVSPLYQAYEFISEPTFFDANTLGTLRESSEHLPLYFLIELELILNTAFFCFSCYFAYCFFTKRTNVPLLATIFYSASLFILVADMVLLEIVAPGNLTETDKADSMRQIVKSFITAAIWVPYFHKSTRVKKTFVRTPLQPKIKY